MYQIQECHLGEEEAFEENKDGHGNEEHEWEGEGGSVEAGIDAIPIAPDPCT